MKSRTVAVAVFTNGKEVVVQERGSHSKVGEKYGFWGGQIEKGETAKETIKRELLEELGYVPEILNYLGEYPYTVSEQCKYKGWRINQLVFTSPITSKLNDVKIREGEGMVTLAIDDAINGEGFPKGSTNFLDKLKK